jgi:hypothetical protein
MLAPMLGPRITTVFRSKWRALWWALSVIVGAYFSVPRSGDADAGAKDAEQAVATLLQQQAPAASDRPAHPLNPWAKSPPR